MLRWMYCVVVGLVLWGCGSGQSTPISTGSVTVASDLVLVAGTAKTGAPIPELEWKLNGQAHKLSDYRGKYVLINFWETTCTPCKREMPDFEQLTKERDDVVVLAINRRERDDLIQAFGSQYGLTFPLLPDRDGSISQAFGVMQVIPMTFFVDTEGTLQRIQIGVMTRSQIDRFLSELTTS